MQLQIFGLLVCLANLSSIRFYHLWLFFISEKCYYLKWAISNCRGFNCLDTQGSVLATVVFWTCSDKMAICVRMSVEGAGILLHVSP